MYEFPSASICSGSVISSSLKHLKPYLLPSHISRRHPVVVTTESWYSAVELAKAENNPSWLLLGSNRRNYNDEIVQQRQILGQSLDYEVGIPALGAFWEVRIDEICRPKSSKLFGRGHDYSTS